MSTANSAMRLACQGERTQTFVCPCRYVDNETELALQVVRVKVRKANEDLVLVDAFDIALEPVLTCRYFRMCTRCVRIQDVLFPPSLCRITQMTL